MTPDDLEQLLNEAARETARERRKSTDADREVTETTAAERVISQ